VLGCGDCRLPAFDQGQKEADINPKKNTIMPEPYSFFRPLLAADKHWAALEWYVAVPESD
jgi:hypothetical protein